MKESFEEVYKRRERDHWWFVARRDLLCSLWKEKKIEGKMVLEVGCGSGENLAVVKEESARAQVYGLDNSRGMIASSARIKNILGDGTYPPLKEEKFDVILALDVLEHIENDRGALNAWIALLKRDGMLILSVPAFNILWSYHDILNEHKRRYNKGNLLNLLSKEAVKIERITFWGGSIFLPTLLLNRLKGVFKSKSGNLYECNRWINYLFKMLLHFENRLIVNGVNLPLGTSLFVMIKKQ